MDHSINQTIKLQPNHQSWNLEMNVEDQQQQQQQQQQLHDDDDDGHGHGHGQLLSSHPPIWPTYHHPLQMNTSTSTQIIPSSSTATLISRTNSSSTTTSCSTIVYCSTSTSQDHHQLQQQLVEEEEELEEKEEEGEEELSAMKEMLYKIAAMQPVDIDPATIRKPKRRNVRISDDPQSVAARHRRERISEKIRILQRLVPGGTKMDTASMLDEAIRYVKFLKRQIRLLQQSHPPPPPPPPPPTHLGWQLLSSSTPPPSKPLLLSTSSSTSLETQQAATATGSGLIAFGAKRGNPMCFNHEVISD